MKIRLLAVLAIFALFSCTKTKQNVILETTLGKITLELDKEKAPISTQNFLRYLDEGFYDGTIFHRVIDGFMVQGGGRSEDLKEKPVHEMIKNEAGNGLTNVRGAVAMARTSALDSATSEFYINLVDNGRLDSMKYTVFGKVVAGMDVVDAMAKTKTLCSSKRRGPCTDPLPPGMKDVPATPILIKKATRD